METLSIELKDIIMSHTPMTYVQNLRLTSTSFCKTTTRQLLSHVHVTPLENGINNFWAVPASPNLAKEVNNIKLTTSLNQNKNFEREGRDLKSSTLSQNYNQALLFINQLPNLRCAAVQFSGACAVEVPSENYTNMHEDGVKFRNQVLSALFDMLYDPEQPVINLRSLSLQNLQNCNEKSIVSSPSFWSVLQRITELRLKIIKGYEHSAQENSRHFPELYNFFDELPSIWL
ncbi:hypothetical protein ONS95_002816 [Cadophora gregata]|uniref:uncharacterized protein n=1 Tax=Cadophora gregata TaxID=51156 RepID=UPI0026DCC612|nr:uncharacterized protein ONS95_002816 [Cadophora gregata]KAK0110165.1 hypothetical protein ONS95_002816 [Cadophora gregata]KAK0110220.1 hypothetical protein ONS96_001843 [Cadophora gregata f. sp. sojae]